MNQDTFQAEIAKPASIKVIGVGGGGCNAINHMLASPVEGVEYISANTDAQSLRVNQAKNRIQLGTTLTRGLGAGGDPEVGKEAALEDRETIAAAIKDTDLLFIATGMGGGTGSGAAAVIAEIAKEQGILTVSVVSTPFKHEGTKRMSIAQQSIENLRQHVDALIIIPNEKLKEVLGKLSLRDAFRAADNVLRDGISCISEIILSTGFMNVDFADVRNVMKNTGLAVMGIGQADGNDRATKAVEMAISSPLLGNVSLTGAKGILVNCSTVSGGFMADEYDEIMETISQFSPDADIKFGVAENDEMPEDELRITLIATGLKEQKETEEIPVRRPESWTRPSPWDIREQTAENVASIPGMEGIVRSGRSARSMNVTAADFANQSVQENFDIPAVLRRD